MSFPPVDTRREEGDATLKNAIRVQRCRRDASLFLPATWQFSIREDDFVRAIFDGEAQTKIDQFRSSISLNRREKTIDSGTGPSIERSWNILEDAVLTGNDLSLSQER